MIITDLQYKLTKLNSGLRIYLNNRTPHHSQYIYGLYVNSFGHDDLIGGVSGPFCPEFSHYDYESGMVVLRGWRDLLHLIIRKGHCSEEKASKVFNVFLRSDYDMLSTEKRLEWCKKKDKWIDGRLKPGESIYLDKWGKKHKLPADNKIIKELMRESQLCGVK